MDQPVEADASSPPVVHGHLKGVDGQIAAQRPRCLPAHDHAGEHVDDERHVHPPGVGLHVGEIGEPQAVRCRRPELALDKISRAVEAVVAFGGAHPDPPTSTPLKTEVSHQSLDGATGDGDAVLVELVPDLVGSIDRQVLLPHPQDLRLELCVADRPGRRRTRLRCVVGGRGDPQDLGDRLDSPAQLPAATVLVAVDEPDHFFDWRSGSAPKKCAAAFKMSLARRNSAFSRLSRFSSASSSLVAPGRRP